MAFELTTPDSTSTARSCLTVTWGRRRSAESVRLAASWAYANAITSRSPGARPSRTLGTSLRASTTATSCNLDRLVVVSWRLSGPNTTSRPLTRRTDVTIVGRGISRVLDSPVAESRFGSSSGLISVTISPTRPSALLAKLIESRPVPSSARWKVSTFTGGLSPSARPCTRLTS